MKTEWKKFLWGGRDGLLYEISEKLIFELINSIVYILFSVGKLIPVKENDFPLPEEGWR